MSDRQINVRQISQYPQAASVGSTDVALLQQGGLGGPYVSILAEDLVANALANGGRLQINANTGAILFGDPAAGGGALNVSSGEFLFSLPIRTSALNAAFVDAAALTQAGVPVVTQAQLDALALVTSFNLRTGDIMLMPGDILRAGGAPIRDAHFGGWITAPSVWDSRANDDTVATTNWVHRAINETGVSSFNGRTGDIVLTTADINAAYANALPGVWPTAPSPVLGDASSRIATTLFVDESLADLHLTISNEQMALLTSTYAPLNSPQLTGIPTAPTANPGTSTGQLATTSFVMHAITAGTTGVASFNTRTGAVTLISADISGAGGALTVSPAFTGTPTAPTATPGTSTTQLATTAFVGAAITAAGGVTSFNTRTGAITLTSADVSGTGVLANTPLTGVPTAPTAAPGTSTTQLATTAFVAAAAAAGVTSFMSRTGAVTLLGADVSAAGGALNASPVFTGTPTAPTPATADSSTTLATTAFVKAAITAGVSGVTTFNGRAGAVTLTTADITGAGGAPLASPTFTGVPAAPTATAGTSTTQLATTAFVMNALTVGTVSLPGFNFFVSGGESVQQSTGNGTVYKIGTGIPNFIQFQNNSNGAVVQVEDATSSAVSVANYLRIYNNTTGGPATIATLGTDTNRSISLVPGGSGTVQAPTMAPGTNSTAIATTAFVAAAATGGIKSVHIQKFTASGAYTYTPTAGMVCCIVEAVGGGGSSGGANGQSTFALGGGGGGGGAYARKILTAAQVGSSLTGSVGAGGAPGGDTSLAALVVAKGGVGGTTATNSVAGSGGAGGLASGSTGDVTINGGNGVAGQWFGGSLTVIISGGLGGGTILSPPTAGALAGSGAGAVGVAGIGYGAGAGGAAANTASTFAGGVGATGVVIITEFCSV